jgi:site-specific recombinase XerD
VLAQLAGVDCLIVQLLYRSGLRPMECMRPGITALDFRQQQILVRDAKGRGAA